MRRVESNLTAAGLLTAFLIKGCGYITAPFKHKGFYKLCKFFSKILLKDENIIIKVENDCIFEIAFKDPYWNRLVSSSYKYEPEIFFLLDHLKKIKYSFVDGGANYGFWSVLVY
tara:strand:+ start:3693 stop:4034 length:342 start_codon:yes stop_codon:yes gene_type:complete